MHYPGNTVPVGFVYEMDMNGHFWDDTQTDYEEEETLKNFPEIFKKLEWWEERKPEEMPKYVKHKSGEVFKPVHFINSWAYPNRQGCTFNGEYYSYSNCQPSTEQEYNDYLKTQTHE